MSLILCAKTLQICKLYLLKMQIVEVLERQEVVQIFAYLYEPMCGQCFVAGLAIWTLD